MFSVLLALRLSRLGEERASLGAFCPFVRFALVWFCLFPLPLGVREGLRFVIVALPGLFFYLFFATERSQKGFCCSSSLFVRRLSLAWPFVVQLLVFIYSDTQ